jgi:hypothetical protein
MSYVRHKRAYRRLLKLGISNFETVSRTRKRQADMLRRVERAGVDPGDYAGLDDCGPNDCGRIKCAEVCWFGSRRRRLEEIPATVELFKNAKPPIHEVRIIRESWQRPAGSLYDLSIMAMKQLNRRALDTLYRPKMQAVGLCKVSFGAMTYAPLWIPEVHEVISGAEKEELEEAFSAFRQIPGMCYNIFSARKVDDIGRAINRVLRRDLRQFRHPSAEDYDPKPKKARRTEYYRWLLGLECGERLIRYGCDGSFQALNKKPRLVRVKIPKKRPYPYHLQRFMFRTEEDEDDMDHQPNCMCRYCAPQLW